ncbi:unnamed protein product [Brachionus calyciflorus]|uniref:Uncharacterized protein n=1 Tax=Brachionus calyciflorus TaxID=104777 RepID=A0A814F721_9BILA|nr:unnamed protein product [Brachionus calyciflorus]
MERKLSEIACEKETNKKLNSIDEKNSEIQQKNSQLDKIESDKIEAENTFNNILKINMDFNSILGDINEKTDCCKFTGCNGDGNTDPRFKKHRSQGHCPIYFNFINNGYKEMRERILQKEDLILTLNKNLQSVINSKKILESKTDEEQKNLIFLKKENNDYKIRIDELESEIKVKEKLIKDFEVEKLKLVSIRHIQ